MSHLPEEREFLTVVAPDLYSAAFETTKLGARRSAGALVVNTAAIIKIFGVRRAQVCGKEP